MSNKSLFLILLLGSFLISNLLWLGTIDQDFYSFYYIGQGVSEGQRMYSNFAENKGPVLYIFFALLYLIFNTNYDWALIAGSTMVDALSLFILFKILEKHFSFKWLKSNTFNLLFIFFTISLYKSFGIGQSMGGLYSENIGMLWLVLGYWTLRSNKFFLSGAVFSLSVLTRLSYLAFIPLFLVEFIFNKKDRKKILSFMLGGLMPLVLFIAYFYITNDLNDFVYSNFSQNMGYLKVGLNLPLSILLVSSLQTRIIIILFLSIFILAFKLFSKTSLREKMILTTLFIGSFMSSFSGGVGNYFYYHHFFQFNFLAIFTISQLIILKGLRPFFIPIFFLLCYFVFLNYYLYIHSSDSNSYSLKDSYPVIKEVSQKKYLMVVPHYPLYYFIYEKRSPDRYFHYFLLSKKFSKDAQKHINRHLEIDDERLAETTFLFVERNQFDKMITDEYKSNFEKEFNLKKIGEYRNLDATIEVYESIKTP